MNSSQQKMGRNGTAKKANSRCRWKVNMSECVWFAMACFCTIQRNMTASICRSHCMPDKNFACKSVRMNTLRYCIRCPCLQFSTQISCRDANVLVMRAKISSSSWFTAFFCNRILSYTSQSVILQIKLTTQPLWFLFLIILVCFRLFILIICEYGCIARLNQYASILAPLGHIDSTAVAFECMGQRPVFILVTQEVFQIEKILFL